MSDVRLRRYRGKADLCGRVARETTDPGQRGLWRALSESYLKVADALDRAAHRRWREEQG